MPRLSPPPVAPPEQARNRGLRGGGARIFASLVIAAGFVWLLSRGGLPLLPPVEDLRRLSLWVIAGYAALQLLAVFLRAYRWVYLLRPIAPRIRTRRVLAIGFVGASAIFFAPLRMGELVRPYLLAEGDDITFVQASGGVFAERVIDGFLLTLFTVSAMSTAHMVSPLPTSLGELPLPLATVPAAVYSATAAFVSLVVAMVVFYAARGGALRLARRVAGMVSPRAADWAGKTVERLADGLSFLPSRSHLAAFLATTLVYWSAVFSAQLILMRGAGLEATPAQAITTVGVVALGSVVPAGPGMFGAFHVASFSSLAMFFPLAAVRVSGAVIVFVSYLSQLLINGVEFVIGMALMTRREPAQSATDG